MTEKIKSHSGSKKVIDRASPIISLVLLLGIFAIGSQLVTRSGAAMTKPVQDALASIPLRLNWGSSTWIKNGDVPVPSNQEKILDLNAHFSKQYRRLGKFPPITAILFVAYCSDARSMAGHHPPNCYPSSGWLMDESRTRKFEINREDGRIVKNCAYHFSRESKVVQSLTVVNGFFAPDEFFASTLEGATEVVRPSLMGGVGLFQFQILFQGDFPDADIEQYVGEIIGGIPKAVFDVAVGSEGDKSIEQATGDDA